MTNASSPVAVRLTPDALHLEVSLAPHARLLPPVQLVALIREQSARLGVDLPLLPGDIEARLRSTPSGRAWITLLSGTAPTPPVDGRVELLVPVPVGDDRRRAGGRHAVRAGAPLARVRRGARGKPGYDLLGRPIPPRAPREARLPTGQNTTAGDDNTLLRAACDGEVVLRNLLVHVVPMRVHEGDVYPGDGPLGVDAALFVTGSVHDGVRIEAGGDVYVAGAVGEAEIVSRNGGVTVSGNVSGSPAAKARLRAAGDVTCGNLLHATVEAGGDVRLLAEARHSVLQAAGSLYLQHTVERGLQEVTMSVAGGLVPLIEPPAPLIDVPTDRQHFRVATRIEGALALHGTPPLTFQPCTIVDLSTSGARCQASRALFSGARAPGAIVQLKLDLPDGQEPLLIVARLSRRVAPGVVGLAFLQMTGRDHDRLTQYCLQLFLARGQAAVATRGNRARASSSMDS